MHYRSLGASGIDASAVGLGTWAIGGWMWGGNEERASIRALHQAFDAGINLVDTAPVYGFGLSETIVGKAIRDRRDRVVLATKCGLIWDKARGEFYFASDEAHPTAAGTIRVFRCLAPEEIRAEVERSLQRLGTDYIDLLQTHWQESTTPVGETMEALMDLKARGIIRAIGCSNATPEQMDEYRAVGDLDTDQERYSMLDREHDASNLPYVAAHGMAFLAYSPLAQGLLTGRIGADRVFAEGDQRRDRPRFSVENRRRVQALLTAIQPVADQRNLSMGQLALAWTIAQPGCSHALAGARTPEQAAENAQAGAIALTEAECTRINTALAAFAREAPDV